MTTKKAMLGEKITKNWYFQKNNLSGYLPRKQNDTFSYDAKKADNQIKRCNVCKKCWQIDWETSRSNYNRLKNRIIYNYYEDFPAYKKELETCPKCNKGNNKHEYSESRTRQKRKTSASNVFIESKQYRSRRKLCSNKSNIR